jgi:hypothetical protein
MGDRFLYRVFFRIFESMGAKKRVFPKLAKFEEKDSKKSEFARYSGMISFIIAAMVISAFLAPASFWSDLGRGITGHQVAGEGTCTDTDGGSNYYTAGTLNVLDNLFQDSCKIVTSPTCDSNSCGGLLVNNCTGDDCVIDEYICDPVSGGVGHSPYYCPYGCSDGACIKACEDSDYGIDFYRKGYLEDQVHNASYDDFCVNETTLREHYCGYENYQYLYKDCQNGCEEGVCIDYPYLNIWESSKAGFNIFQNGAASPSSRDFDYTWCKQENPSAEGGGPFEFRWGDGNISCSWFEAAHIYADYGNYTIAVRAKNSRELISERFSYADIRAGADLGAYLSINSLIIHESNIIYGRVFNDGTLPAENASIALYVQKGYCYDSCDNLSFIGLQNINLGSVEGQEFNFSWTPLLDGDYTLVLIPHADNEAYPEEQKTLYYSIGARERGADLTADIYPLDNYYGLLLNEPKRFTVTLSNRGVEDATGVSAEIYYQKGDCYLDSDYAPCDNLTLSKDYSTVSLAAEQGHHDLFYYNFVPLEEGAYTFVAIVNATNEIWPEDNIRDFHFDSRNRGADLQGWLNYDRLIVGMPSNLTVQISNRGIELPLDSTASIYYHEGWCYASEESDNPCTNLSLIGTKPIGAESLPGYNSQLIFEFTPIKAKTYVFVLMLNASNEIYPKDNVAFYSYDARYPGPDVTLWTEFFGNVIIGEENPITVTVFNRGTENAENIDVSLYDYIYESPPKGGNEIAILRDSEIIDSLEPGATKQINLSYNPPQKGYNSIKINATLMGDVYADNTWFSGVYAHSRGVDLSIESVWGWLIKGIPSTIEVWIANYGMDIPENMLLKLYVDNLLVEEEPLDFEEGVNNDYVAFNYTPSSSGEKQIRAVLDAPGDIDSSNNELNLSFISYDLTNITLRVTDNAGDFVQRYVFAYSYGLWTFTKLNQSTLILPVITGQDAKTEFALLYSPGTYEDYEEPESLIKANKSLIGHICNAKFSDFPGTVISEYYPNMTQDGREFYMVFANKASFDCIGSQFFVMMNEESLNELGISAANVSQYGGFYCENFDFTSKKCASSWIEEDLGGFREEKYTGFSYSSYNGLTSDETRVVTAFAIGKSSAPSVREFTANSENPEILETLVLERAAGSLEILENLDMTRYGGDPERILNYIRIYPGRIVVNTDYLPEFKNISARLTFYNINMTSPKLLYNGQQCPSSLCTNINYDTESNILTVYVSGFSEFEVVEGNVVTRRGHTGTSTNRISQTLSGETITGECIPEWTCGWTACLNGQQRVACTDLNACGVDTDKPQEQIRQCAVEGGNALPLAEPGGEAKETSNFWRIFAIILMIAIAAAIVIALIVLLRKPRASAPAEEQGTKPTAPIAAKPIEPEITYPSTLMNQAREIVKDARSKGYSDEEIRQRFAESGWTEDNIEIILI